MLCSSQGIAPVTLRKAVVPIALLAVLGGCAKTGDIDLTSGVGITAVRSACPSVGVPAGTGDITLFDPANSQDERAIDVVANITNVRSTCDDSGAEVQTTITFDVRARRTRTEGARDVTLPYFITVVRGGNAVTAKRIGLHFEAGQALASTNGQASTTVNREAATLSKEVRDKLNRKRKAGEQDAAVDPLASPDVRQAVLSASFEALVGFQLTQDQLKYNAQR